jgi:hypothetical protein
MPYVEQYPVGAAVRIGSLHRLQAFKRDWTFHHPIQDEQLRFAGTRDIVKTVGYYHGGAVIYTLENAVGIWHEQLLDPA